jgi:hydrogenase maturation protein HypF
LSLDWDERLAPVMEFNEAERTLLHTQLEKKINTPLTSSMGRSFDAIATLADVRQRVFGRFGRGGELFLGAESG